MFNSLWNSRPTSFWKQIVGHYFIAMCFIIFNCVTEFLLWYAACIFTGKALRMSVCVPSGSACLWSFTHLISDTHQLLSHMMNSHIFLNKCFLFLNWTSYYYSHFQNKLLKIASRQPLCSEQIMWYRHIQCLQNLFTPKRLVVPPPHLYCNINAKYITMWNYLFYFSSQESHNPILIYLNLMLVNTFWRPCLSNNYILNIIWQLVPTMKSNQLWRVLTAQIVHWICIIQLTMVTLLRAVLNHY